MTAREAAFRALDACRRQGAWSEVFLRSLCEKERMEARETALAYSLCMTVLQNEKLCDYYISRFSSVKPKKMEAGVLLVLRLAACQLFLMDRIPPSAAVNESVELAKKHCPGRSIGFINAVARAMAAAEVPPEFPNDLSKAEYYSLKYSHPQWLAEYFISRLGVKAAQELLRADNSAPPVYLHVNTLKTDAAGLKRALEEEGVSFEEHPDLPGCLVLSSAAGIETTKAFKNGLFQIQDCASRLAVMAAAPKPGEKVLDACAAPGGKSFAAAMLMENRGEILSCDIHKNKLVRIEEGAKRLGIDIISVNAMDASVYEPAFEGAFDTVLADVPCSGLGVIRKKPEIRNKKPEDIAALPELQLAILSNLSRYVRPGGMILYSTCTVSEAENEGVINTFLSNNSLFRPETFALPITGEVKSGMATLWPHIHGTDGFFICRLRKDE